MGRHHGTGGSDDGDERGNSSAFWGPDEQTEPPGWPSLPDQPEVTGQWAPMPRRADTPAPRGPQPEPFETTGAFALPNDHAGGPAGALPPRRGPREDEAGPFETTGAFVRPSEWDQPGGRRDFAGPATGDFGPATGDFPAVPPGDPFAGPDATPGAQGPNPFDRPTPLDGAAERTSFFDVPAERTAFFDRPRDHEVPPPGHPGPFDGPGRGAPGPFGGPDGNPGPFGGPDNGPGRFDGPGGGPGGGPGPFGGPGGGPGPFDGPGDRTARFDAPPGPVFGGPPEPGDVKVAGEPTSAMAPAWAEAETGFLGSGWSNDSDDPGEEPRGRRGRRKQGRGGGGGDDDLLAAPSGAGKGRVALLSVAAVAIVLGGTVAGVKFVSSGDQGKCEGATCAAVQITSGQPGPVASEPTEEESEQAPEDDPADETTAKEDEPSETPTPTATYNVRTPPRTTSSPTPTPSKSRTKTPAQPEEDTKESPAEESVSETPTEEVSTVDDSDTEGGGGSTENTATPAPTTGTFGQTGNAGSVNVKQTIQQRITSYSANLTLSNTSPVTLQNPTVSVPVDGRVTDVDGAEWTQDGDLLILDVSASLAAGASVQVTFKATGRGSEAQNCGLVAGECVIT
ncbi:hypothetical protein ACWEPC_04780 [Nonomuraea sp. NPDC004297]